MSRKASIVVGLGFGDEGKGLATDYLCSQSARPLVIRFNGGQQAGHTVCLPDGKRHVFSSFGAGTLRGAATYWSAYCTCSLSAMLNEYKALTELAVVPQLFLDEDCAVTTHYDILYNRLQEQQRGNDKHGSCGMGFGATVQRQSAQVSLTVKDLLQPDNCAARLSKIRAYYSLKAGKELNIDFCGFDHDKEDARFLDYVEQVQALLNGPLFITTEAEIFKCKRWADYVFEGAQGILLDMDLGYFPHVTRSNTTSKNGLEIINRNKESFSSAEIYYISRVYHTRHGEGPFVRQSKPLQLINNGAETNVFNNHQGSFRIGPLDINKVQYALQADNNISKGFTKNLILTCVDQIDKDSLVYAYNNEVRTIAASYLPALLQQPFSKVFMSQNACSERLVQA